MAGKPTTKTTTNKTRPLTKAQEEEICTLHSQGVAKSVIAERLKITTFQLTRFAKQAGLDFSAARLAEANAVRMEDMKQRRLILADQLLSDAERIRVRCRSTHSWYEKNGDKLVLVSLPEPTLPMVASGMSAVATAVKTHMDLIGNQEHGTTGHVRSMVSNLMEQIGVAAKNGALEKVEEVAEDLARAEKQQTDDAAAKERAEVEAQERVAEQLRGES